MPYGASWRYTGQFKQKVKLKQAVEENKLIFLEVFLWIQVSYL